MWKKTPVINSTAGSMNRVMARRAKVRYNAIDRMHGTMAKKGMKVMDKAMMKK